MGKKQPARNQPCPCGSGMKYKKCCIDRKITGTDDQSEIESIIQKAINDLLADDNRTIQSAVEILARLSQSKSLSGSRCETVFMNLARGLQRLGRHHEALDQLNKLADSDVKPSDESLAWFLQLSGISLAALGQITQACERFEQALDLSSRSKPMLRGSIAMEAGRSYYIAKDFARANELWREAEALFEKAGDIEHLTRVRSNLSFAELRNPSPDLQDRAEQKLEQASRVKLQIGDLSGLAVNYCNLALHFRRKRRFSRAIAYARKDLSLSRHIGDRANVATSLMNLGAIYIDLLQPSRARTVTSEAQAIGEELRDHFIIARAEHNLRAIGELARDAGKAGKVIGPKAPCECGSGTQYDKCCGLADFEPADIFVQMGISKEVERLSTENKQAGIPNSHLDFILREGPDVTRRTSWRKVQVHDGWLEWSELADAANLHLLSARSLATEASADPDGAAKPIASLILAACALEAFINQVVFFLYEVQRFPEKILHLLPPEMSGDATDFQRRTGLIDKWQILGQALCGSAWPPKAELWDDFLRLVDLRNELVHFKSSEYEPIIPRPKDPHYNVRKLPASVIPRDTFASWPNRVLTPALASWAVKVAEDLMSYFRCGYRDTRLAASGGKSQNPV